MSGEYGISNVNIRRTIAHKKVEVLEINISYPKVSAPKNRLFERRFNEYYAFQMRAYESYAKTKLLKSARESLMADVLAGGANDFRKWGAMAHFRIGESAGEPDMLWVIQRIWIFRDNDRRGTQINQVWNTADATVRKAREESGSIVWENFG